MIPLFNWILVNGYNFLKQKQTKCVYVEAFKKILFDQALVVYVG